MFIPLSTDAPVYHFPFATIGLIVACLFGTVLVAIAPDAAEPFLLHFGSFNPLQWLTSIFLHINFLHFLGNAVALWTFGLIVEGKVGWQRMLVICLTIGLAEGAIQQIITLLATEGASLGFSGVIYGLMAISLLWAPVNEIQGYLLIYFVYGIAIDVTVSVMVGILLALQFVIVAFSSLEITSELLHLMGGILGGIVGFVMLRRRWVDCEFYDLFSVIKGLHDLPPEERPKHELKSPEAQVQQQANQQRNSEASLAQIRGLLAEGHVDTAWRAHQHLQRRADGWRIPDDTLLEIIAAYHAEQRWRDSMPAMVEYQMSERPRVTDVRLKLAEILIVAEQRPAQALRILKKIDRATLGATAISTYKKLLANAERMREEDPLEVVEDW